MEKSPTQTFNYNGGTGAHRIGNVTHSGPTIGMGEQRPIEVDMSPIQAFIIGMGLQRSTEVDLSPIQAFIIGMGVQRPTEAGMSPIQAFIIGMAYAHYLCILFE